MGKVVSFALMIGALVSSLQPASAKKPLCSPLKQDKILTTAQLKDYVVHWWIAGDIDRRLFYKNGQCLYNDQSYFGSHVPDKDCTYTIADNKICYTFKDGTASKCEQIKDNGARCRGDKYPTYWRDDEKGFRHSYHRQLQLAPSEP